MKQERRRNEYGFLPELLAAINAVALGETVVHALPRNPYELSVVPLRFERSQGKFPHAQVP